MDLDVDDSTCGECGGKNEGEDEGEFERGALERVDNKAKRRTQSNTILKKLKNHLSPSSMRS